MYIWARRSFDLLSFVVLLALGPIFLAATSVLMLTGYAITFRASAACAGNSPADMIASRLEGCHIENMTMKSELPGAATQRQSRDLSSLAA
jgi:hypothetical protein